MNSEISKLLFPILMIYFETSSTSPENSCVSLVEEWI